MIKYKTKIFEKCTAQKPGMVTHYNGSNYGINILILFGFSFLASISNEKYLFVKIRLKKNVCTKIMSIKKLSNNLRGTYIVDSGKKEENIEFIKINDVYIKRVVKFNLKTDYDP